MYEAKNYTGKKKKGRNTRRPSPKKRPLEENSPGDELLENGIKSDEEEEEEVWGIDIDGLKIHR